MCRYATRYKPHYACFDCRKVFRRMLLSDIKNGGEDRPFRCPQCAGEMADMGLDFAAPKKTDLKAWRVAESLFEIGQTFHSCGCNGPGYRPRNPRALRQSLESLLAEFSENAKHPERCFARAPRPEELAETRSYWAERVVALRGMLATLGT